MKPALAFVFSLIPNIALAAATCPAPLVHDPLNRCVCPGGQLTNWDFVNVGGTKACPLTSSEFPFSSHQRSQVITTAANSPSGGVSLPGGPTNHPPVNPPGGGGSGGGGPTINPTGGGGGTTGGGGGGGGGGGSGCGHGNGGNCGVGVGNGGGDGTGNEGNGKGPKTGPKHNTHP
jgi:hypothetical protein